DIGVMVPLRLQHVVEPIYGWLAIVVREGDEIGFQGESRLNCSIPRMCYAAAGLVHIERCELPNDSPVVRLGLVVDDDEADVRAFRLGEVRNRRKVSAKHLGARTRADANRDASGDRIRVRSTDSHLQGTHRILPCGYECGYIFGLREILAEKQLIMLTSGGC